MIDVVAFGEILIDFAQIKINEKGYPTLSANPGGAPANFLAPISKYGLNTAMIGKVGDDTFGNLLINSLNENNINTKSVLKDPSCFTTLAFVTFDKNNDRRFSFSRKPGADTLVKYEEIDKTIIDECKIFHFGTLSLTNNPSKNTTKQLVKYAKEKNKIISFDPNLREPLWDDLNKAKEAIIYGLKNADIVKISLEEVYFLYDIKTENMIDYLLNKFKNIKLLYITCGDKGVYYSNRIHRGYCPSLKNIKIIDTTGAGDIFGGSAMYKYLKINKKIDELDDDDLKNIVNFATISAGLSCTKMGGISSVCDLKEIENY